MLLTNASEDFDWSQISPTIFGRYLNQPLTPKLEDKVECTIPL